MATTPATTVERRRTRIKWPGWAGDAIVAQARDAH
jgi:hypothetical protein